MTAATSFIRSRFITELQRLWSGAWAYFSEHEIPGTIIKSNVHGTRQVFTVELGVTLYDRTGKQIESVVCEPAPGARRGSRVSLIVRDPDNDSVRVHGEIRRLFTSEQEFEQAVQAFGIDHAAWINITEAASPLSEPVKLAEAEVSRIRSDVDEQRAELDQQKQWIFEQQSKLEQDRLRVEEKERRADVILASQSQFQSDVREFEECGGKVVAALLRPLVANAKEPSTRQDPVSVRDALEHFMHSAEQLRYTCDEFTAVQFIAAMCSAVRTGQFITISGPTGTGKTSLISLAAKIFDCEHGVIPVRPAWIDSTDLLGFFDIRNERFHPTPFMDYLVKASEQKDQDRVFLLTLDEMNLARVENYAGDLLSRLEKRNDGDGVLRLYSSEISQLLQLRIGDLKHSLGTCTGNVNNELSERVLLKHHLLRYPPDISIPPGLCILGTLNLDETTYVPSPKFLDRSFAIQKYPSPLDVVVAPRVQTGVFHARTLKRSELEQLACDGRDPHYRAVAAAVQSNAGALSELGIHLGFRFAEAAMAFCAITSLWRGVSDCDAVDAIFLSKVLPKLTFHEDDKSPSGDLKRHVLEEWSASETMKPFSRSRSALERTLSLGGPIFRYLE